jgi:hypothetical protein
MTTSRKSWTERMAAANNERKAAEETQYGMLVETMLGKFFVTEDVIPASCKNYKNGKLASYTIDKNTQTLCIIQEIFRRNHSLSHGKITKNINPIKIRMLALLNILKFDSSKATILEKNIYKSALLGAAAALLTALENDSVFSDVLNIQFRKKLRNAIYHFGCAVDNKSELSLKRLFLHIYEHCREELLTCHKFPSLAAEITHEEKSEASFQGLIMHFLETHRIFYEWKKGVVTELDQQKTILDAIIKFYNENTGAHFSGEFPKETALAIRGNAIGLHVARLSSGAMSLLDQRAFQMDDKNEIDFVSLTEEERASIEKKFDGFIKIGNDFRHNNIDYSCLPQKFNVSLPASGNQSVAEKSAEKNPYSKAQSTNTKTSPALFKSQNSISSSTATSSNPALHRPK